MMNLSSLSKAIYFTMGNALVMGMLVVLEIVGMLPNLVLIVLSGSAIVLSALALVFALKARTNLNAISKACKHVSYGDFEKRIILLDDNGEIKKMSSLVNELIDRSDAYVRESQATLEAVAGNIYYRNINTQGMVGTFKRSAVSMNKSIGIIHDKVKTFEGITKQFEDNVGKVIATFNETSGMLNDASGRMDDAAGHTSSEAEKVAIGAQDAVMNMQTVASATEELTSSITEISRNVHRSNEITGDAVIKVEDTQNSILSLSKAADSIGDVISLITDIADQTNLLALNATIEAARAGEMGKGFAVVAAEVKDLASQTAKATDGIIEQVDTIRKAVDLSVAQFEDVSTTIAEVKEISTGVAAAVEQQSAATQEIAQSVIHAKDGTTEITNSIGSVSDVAKVAKEAAAEVIGSTSSLMEQSGVLRSEIDHFMQEARKVI